MCQQPQAVACLCVCACPGSVVAAVCELEAMLTVCAVQVVTWLSDSFSEVSMHNSTADQSGC